tara:strand:+ start:190 stop:795 length:606 start_codon:yes stop_codon:yes gene_type:complete
MSWKWKKYFYVKEDFLTRDFCQKIINVAERGNTQVEDRNIAATRKSDVIFLDQNSHNDWLYDPIYELLEETRRKNWRTFKLQSLQNLQYTMYQGDGGHYTWHTDTAGHNSGHGMSERVLTMAAMLSDPDEYDGGEFEIVNGVTDDINKVLYTQPPDRALVETLKPPMGAAIVFPSIVQHRVVPLTRGFRRSLVGWCCGRFI